MVALIEIPEALADFFGPPIREVELAGVGYADDANDDSMEAIDKHTLESAHPFELLEGRI